ncbi:hypothetical protein [Streptomyces sp. NPDC001205]
MSAKTETPALTAADHFREGERLLAEPLTNSDAMTAYATRAHAHFAAARLLLDAHTQIYNTTGASGLSDAGLRDLIQERDLHPASF